jgi:hypothetical protein
MKAPKIPKFFREYYNPTAREWLRWLRFKRRVIDLAAEGHSALYQYYEACAKDRRLATCGRSSSGMYPGSGSSSCEIAVFEWAWLARSESFQGTMIDLTCDAHDSDIRTIASTNDF